MYNTKTLINSFSQSLSVWLSDYQLPEVNLLLCDNVLTVRYLSGSYGRYY